MTSQGISKFLHSLEKQGLSRKQIRYLTGIPERSQRRYSNRPFEVKTPSKKTLERCESVKDKISKDRTRSYRIKRFFKIDIEQIEKFINSDEKRFLYVAAWVSFKSDKGKYLFPVYSRTDSKEYWRDLVNETLEKAKQFVSQYKIKRFNIIYWEFFLTDFIHDILDQEED